MTQKLLTLLCCVLNNDVVACVFCPLVFEIPCYVLNLNSNLKLKRIKISQKSASNFVFLFTGHDREGHHMHPALQSTIRFNAKDCGPAPYTYVLYIAQLFYKTKLCYSPLTKLWHEVGVTFNLNQSVTSIQ